PGDACRITPAGLMWLEASFQGYTNRMRQNGSRSRSGRPVSYNFFGPSNVVQGHNYGSISANQNNGPSSAELLAAMREVLDLTSIPWKSPELTDVRAELVRAVAKSDPL